MYISMARSLLLVLITVSCIAIIFFLSGFLLTKTEIRQKSAPSEHHNPAQIFRDSGIDVKSKYESLMQEYTTSTTQSEAKKVFLFVIDALRFDLFQPSMTMESMCERTMNTEALEDMNEKPRKKNITRFAKDPMWTMRYKHNNKIPEKTKLNYSSCTYNQFPQLHKLLFEDSARSFLYKSYADPPTTTSQRLKGMTTGSIPAFIELGSNFESAAITEDNIIHQALNAGKKVAVIGDDTWERLFPSQLDLSVPFDSFNTMDLDTVDMGVEQTLNELMANNTLLDYDLVVAHFLGVDHIGHTYNAFDILMGERYACLSVSVSVSV